ncbi:MAG: carboxypeptidase regulatory-like domain-containing protein [Bryobacteraceae bacterium]
MFAQGHRAIILGRVTDSSGAAMPGVAVKVVRTDTNVARETETNTDGIYEVPGLLPGAYRVEASRPGFKTAIVDSIPVTGGKHIEINLVVQVGEVKESVTVNSETQILDTVSADVNTVVDQRKITELPIGQGNAHIFLLLAPGADMARQGAGMDMQPLQRSLQGTTRFNGSPAGTNEYTLDGTPNTQRGNGPAGGGASVLPSTEVVQEVRVQTATFDASIGHTGGATVDMVLKSGGNQYRGAAYGFIRDPGWNANSWQANRGGTPRPDFTFRRWGFHGGGPATIPGLYKGKDRTFFYYGWESWSSFSPNPPSVMSVPRPAHLNGDFSDLLALGARYQLYDPSTARAAPNGRIQRDPLPGNRIPSNRLDPAAQAFNRLWLAPNTAGTADGQNNFTYNGSNLPRDMWTSLVRIDHNLGVSHKLFGRMVISKTGIPFNSQFGRTDISNLTFTGRNRDFAVTDVWTISPAFIADFRAALTRFHWDTDPIGLGIDYGSLGMDSLSRLINTTRIGIPRVNVTGYLSGGATFGQSPGSRQMSEIRTGAVHFTRVIGSHSVRFGADIRWYFDNRGREDQLTLAFAPRYTIGPFDNSEAPPHAAAFADFLFGRFSQATLNQPVKPANLATYQSFYLQDEWKITPRLTLSMGLRYEREGPATERFNQALAEFDGGVDSPIAEQARANYARDPIPELAVAQFQVKGGIRFAGVNSAPRTIYEASNRNFAPRIGVAYQVNRETVIRTGYGIFFIPNGQRFIANEGGVPGFDVNTFSFATNDGGLTFNRALANLFPGGLDKGTGTALGLATNLGQGISVPAPRRNPNAMNQRWQFSVQRRLGSAHRLEARYVGNRTVRMPVPRNHGALDNRWLSNSPERDQQVIDNLSALVSNPFFGVSGVSGGIGNSRVIAKSELLRPFPQFASVTVPTSQGGSSYHALQVEFERRLAGGLTLQTNYTYAKTIDALSYLNPADPLPERVVADADRTHLWRMLVLYELPFGKGRRWGGGGGALADRLIGGWQIQAIPILQVGQPLVWPNVLFRGNIKDIEVDRQTPARMFNPDAGFERVPARQLAANRRVFPTRLSGVRLPTETNLDFSLLKNTTITERFTLQFRAEAYNALNQRFNLNAILEPVNPGFGSSTTANVPRAVQLGFRLIF